MGVDPSSLANVTLKKTRPVSPALFVETSAKLRAARRREIADQRPPGGYTTRLQSEAYADALARLRRSAA